MSELVHSDRWGWCGNRTVSRPEANTTPEQAMALLLEHARLFHGEQDWAAWTWEAREYGTREPRIIPFTWVDGVWTRPPP